jgi:hypothetical protein
MVQFEDVDLQGVAGLRSVDPDGTGQVVDRVEVEAGVVVCGARPDLPFAGDLDVIADRVTGIDGSEWVPDRRPTGDG